jgi:hypothetical protein
MSGVIVKNSIYFSSKQTCGQPFTQIRHLIHFELSTVGAPNPFWLIALAGHFVTMGQTWFCGHFSLITFIIVSLFLKN